MVNNLMVSLEGCSSAYRRFANSSNKADGASFNILLGVMVELTIASSMFGDKCKNEHTQENPKQSGFGSKSLSRCLTGTYSMIGAMKIKHGLPIPPYRLPRNH